MNATPYENALNQLLYALALIGIEYDPDFLNRLRQIGTGKAHIDVETDVAFSDLMRTLELKARSAGMIK
ncbi:hypothetical protein P7A99_13830 [Caulobacter endophyticus]|nr:hypothetical protein [Caulobacter endophyticus]